MATSTACRVEDAPPHLPAKPHLQPHARPDALSLFFLLHPTSWLALHNFHFDFDYGTTSDLVRQVTGKDPRLLITNHLPIISSHRLARSLRCLFPSLLQRPSRVALLVPHPSQPADAQLPLAQQHNLSLSAVACQSTISPHPQP